MRDALASRIFQKQQPAMRTTIDIADDVLLAAKEAARRQKTSLGAVISDLARRSLVQPGSAAPSRGAVPRGRLARLGIQPLPKRGGVVSNETINQLRDDGIY
jgi:hypothetical protein